MRRNSHPPRKSTRPNPAGWQQPQQHNYRATAICGSLSLLTGAAAGAALMYVLDPESGRQRRQAAYDVAHNAYGAAHDAVESAVGSARQAAGNAYDAVTSAKLPTTQQAMNVGKDLLGRGMDAASDFLPQRRRPTDVSGTTAASLAVGALAGGLAAMWLFDPDRGRGRRAWIGQKTTRFANETGSFMRATGRHLRNRAKGYSHDAQHYASDMVDSVADSELLQRVRDAIAPLGIAMSSLRIAVTQGQVQLSGKIIRDQINRIVEMVRNIPGVRGITNQLSAESEQEKTANA